MKVLVSGGAGYVGSILVPELLGKHYKVRVLDNLMYNQTSLLPYFSNKNFEFLKGDIRNKKLVGQAVRDVDFIIHLAAIVGAPACRRDKRLAKEVNYEGTVNLDNARSKSQGVIFASTTSGYGTKREIKGLCTEETPIEPISTYGRTKLDAEQHLVDSGNMVGYRFATAFGLSPRLRLDLLVNDFVFQALKNRSLIVYDSENRRTFIHIKDMARSFIHAIENFDDMKDEIYNVGSENMNCTKRDLAEKIHKKIDFHLYYSEEFGSDPDKRDYKVSFEKLRSTGYETTINLDEGIDELINGFEMITLHNPYSNVEE